MAFDYVNKIANVVNVLTAHNTTTAAIDLSASMTTRVQNIFNDDPDVRGLHAGSESPALFVSVESAGDAETQIGDFPNRKKEKTVVYDIRGVLRRDTFSTEHTDHLTDFYQFANNVEAVLKAEATLSDTALHMEVFETDFKSSVRSDESDNSYVKVFAIRLNVRYIYS